MFPSALELQLQNNYKTTTKQLQNNNNMYPNYTYTSKSVHLGKEKMVYLKTKQNIGWYQNMQTLIGYTMLHVLLIEIQ